MTIVTLRVSPEDALEIIESKEAHNYNYV